jgi:hypothetical protein
MATDAIPMTLQPIPIGELPENLKPLATEIATFFRELPRLLAEGEEGRYLLLKGDRIYSTWDSLRDALQAGHEVFGLDQPFMAQKVSLRDARRFAKWMPGWVPLLPGDDPCPS